MGAIPILEVRSYLEHLLPVFVRCSGFFMFLPALGTERLPLRIRLSVAISISIIVTSIVENKIEKVTFGLIVFEAAVGFVFGIFIWALLLTLKIAGSIIGQSTSMSQLLGNSGTDPVPAFGRFLTLAGYCALFIYGYHYYIVSVLAKSYELVPVGSEFNTALYIEQFLTHVSDVMALAFSLSTPFLIISLVYNLTLGVISRAMPQLMVAFVGAPAITAAGLIAFALCATAMIARWNDHMISYLSLMSGN